MRITCSRPTLGALLLLLAACGGGGDGEPSGVATVAGTVRRAGTDTPIAGVTVSAGELSATTGTDGRYALAGVLAGERTLLASAPGYDPYSAQVAVTPAVTSHDIALTPGTVFRSDSAAIYIPAGIGTVRAVMLYLGGFDTRPVATGQFPDTDVGRSQRSLREALEGLAAQQGMALMGIRPLGGTGTTADDAIISALAGLAARSAHPEVADAPLVLLGISAGAAPVYGFLHRQPQRTLAFLTWIGVPIVPGRSVAAQQVPGQILLAERDTIIKNDDVRAWFDANRAAGALWSLGVRPGARHEPPDAAFRSLIVQWIDEQLTRRLAAGGGVLVPPQETAGWLGDLTTLAISAHAQYLGDPLKAAWLPSQAAAEQWRAFVTLAP